MTTLPEDAQVQFLPSIHIAERKSVNVFFGISLITNPTETVPALFVVYQMRLHIG